MSDSVIVDPAQLRRAGGEFVTHSDNLVAVHLSARGQADAAHAGWVGRSAGELWDLLGRWTATTISHATRLEDQSSGLHLSAAEFRNTEQGNAAAIAQVFGGTPDG